MPEIAKIERVPRSSSARPPRFATVQQFLDEYDKGSKLPIDLDPRIDFTKPVYEQVIALQNTEEEVDARASRRKKHARPQ